MGFRQYLANTNFDQLVESKRQLTKEIEEALKKALSEYLNEFS